MQSFWYQVDSKCPRQFVNCKMNMHQSNWSPITFYSHCSGKTTKLDSNNNLANKTCNQVSQNKYCYHYSQFDKLLLQQQTNWICELLKAFCKKKVVGLRQLCSVVLQIIHLVLCVYLIASEKTKGQKSSGTSWGVGALQHLFAFLLCNYKY